MLLALHIMRGNDSSVMKPNILLSEAKKSSSTTTGILRLIAARLMARRRFEHFKYYAVHYLVALVWTMLKNGSMCVLT